MATFLAMGAMYACLGATTTFGALWAVIALALAMWILPRENSACDTIIATIEARAKLRPPQ